MFTLIKRLVYLGIFVAMLMAAYQFSMPYLKYMSFRTDAKDIIHFKVRRPSDMQAKLLQGALDSGLPVTADNIEVIKLESGNYEAYIEWDETVDLFNLGKYKKTLEFSVEVGG